MATVHLRLTGNADTARELINALGSIEGVDSAEQVADLMPHMDDEDSSSAGLPDDNGPGFHAIEVRTSTDRAADQALEVARTVARDAGAALERVDDV